MVSPFARPEQLRGGSQGERVGKAGFMTLRLREVQIENVNNYPAGVVQDLRQALRAGVLVVPDPKRPSFFDVYADDQRFYIDVLGDGNRVILLSAWTTVN